MSLNEELETYARERGVDFVGVTTVAPFAVGPDLKPVDPRELMPEATSLVVTGFYTYTNEPCLPSTRGTPRGKFGPWTRLSRSAVAYQTDVATAFFRERGFAARFVSELPAKAGAVRAGWAQYGRNCIVHAPGAGSYVKLTTLLTDAELEAAEHPVETSDCGDCDECVTACPTGALAEPYHLDRGKCICAWLWGRPIPRELRPTVGDHLHRCSYCQDACPLNQELKPRESLPFALDGPTPTPELIPLLLGDEDLLKGALPEFVMSAGAETIRRNVALALGNVGDPAAVKALSEAIQDAAPRVRGYAAWALGQIGGAEARSALETVLLQEQDEEVRTEIEAALRT